MTSTQFEFRAESNAGVTPPAYTGHARLVIPTALPTWARSEQFGLAGPRELPVREPAADLFPGILGANSRDNPSSLDRIQNQPIMDIQMAESAMQSTTESATDPETVPGRVVDNPVSQRMLEQFNMIQRHSNRSAQGRGRGNNGANTRDQRQEVSEASSFDGDVRSCPICLQDFAARERIYRFPCRHMVHSECWETHLSHRQQDRLAELGRLSECPTCRGSGEIIATFLYVAPREVSRGRIVHLSTRELMIGQRASSRAHSQDSNQSFSSVQSQVTHVQHTFLQVMLPVNPATGTNVPPGYHPCLLYTSPSPRDS